MTACIERVLDLFKSLCLRCLFALVVLFFAFTHLEAEKMSKEHHDSFPAPFRT